MLGCGSVGHILLERFTDRNGDTLVIDEDESRVETLRDENIAAEHGDPTDPAILDTLDDDIETIVTAATDPTANLAAAKTARRVFPTAYLVIYTGENPDTATRDEMEATADSLVDHGRTIATRLIDTIDSEGGDRLYDLQQTLDRIDGRLGVFMHDNPDPDAIASAIALREIAAARGIEADACYFGEIAHQENRALVNLLDLTLVQYDPSTFDPDLYDSVALVDHSRAGVNDHLPADIKVDIVIDHHPPRTPIDARYYDLRSDVGATSTLLVDYYRRSGLTIDATIATALLYGIRVDTQDFGREPSDADFDAAAFLLPHTDPSILEQVESPSVSGTTLDTIADAIRNREQRGSVIATCVGQIVDRDSLSQAAEHLLGMQGVSTTMVYGFMDGTIHVSARTRGTDLDIGEVLLDAFDRIGSAGGHAEMAGAQLPMGILGSIEEEQEESIQAVVSDVVSNRFFETIAAGVTRPVSQYRQESDPHHAD